MYMRYNPLRFVLLIGLLAAIVTSAGTPTPQTPSATTYQSIPPSAQFKHASADLIVPNSDGRGNAVVLVGNVEGASNAAQNAASEAVSDFSDAGFNTSLDRDATVEEAVSAINDETRVVVIIGHGDGDTKKSSFNEGIQMADGNWLDSASFSGQTFPNVERVILHACGQLNQQSWRNLFPNAIINGWAGPTRGWQFYWWQYFFTADANLPTPDTDTRLGSIESPVFGGRMRATIGSPIDPLFQMSPGLSAAFGSQTMNIFGTDDDGLNEVLLVGLTITKGRVTAFDDIGYISTSFDVRVKYSDMFNAFENPNSIVDAFNAGRIAIDTHRPGLDKKIMFYGFAAVNFGVNATFAALVWEMPGEVTLGQKTNFFGAGFTPNGDVGVIILRSDNTSIEHLGKADANGYFNGTVTVSEDKPIGTYTIIATDLSTGQTIAIPFRVIPLVTATPDIPTFTATPVPPTITPTLMPTPTIPLSRALPTPTVLILPCAILVVIFIALLAGLVVFMRRRFRRRRPLPPPQPPPQQQPQQCGFRQETFLRTVEGEWKVKEATTVAIPPHHDPATVVVWEKKIYNEFEVIGPCPLPLGHAGDHQPKTVERRFVSSFTEQESYPHSVRKPKPPKDKGLPKIKD